MTDLITLEQFRALAHGEAVYNRRPHEAANGPVISNLRPQTGENKYHARRCYGYDSRKEYRRAQQLKIMQQAGIISGLREQVSFQLLPSQRNSEGRAERPVRYIADFVYTHVATGRTVVEDTKGVRTPDYVIKRKLMLFVHGITITEI